MAFITKEQRREYGFTSNDYNYEMNLKEIAKYRIDLYDLYPECEEKIKELLKRDKFATGQMETKKGYQTLKLTKENNKILIEFDNTGYSFDYLIPLEAEKLSQKEFDKMIERTYNKAIEKFDIDDYEGDPIYAEFAVITEPSYEKLAEKVRKLAEKIEARDAFTQENFGDLYLEELKQMRAQNMSHQRK